MRQPHPSDPSFCPTLLLLPSIPLEVAKMPNKPRRRAIFLALLGLGVSGLLFLPTAFGDRAQSAFGAPLAVLLKVPSLTAGKIRREWATLVGWFGLGDENRRLKSELTLLKLEHQQLQERVAVLQRG